MDYMNYIRGTLESIKSAISTAKDVLITVGNIIGTLVEILGFIGFRVFVLLISTAFVLWILNLVSPISKKTNYVIAVGLVLWLAITAKMPLQIVILKYIFIIILPLIITTLANFFVRNFSTVIKIILSKSRIAFIKITSHINKGNKWSIDYGDNIGLVFTSDLPTLNEISNANSFFKIANYKMIVVEGEKISLVDDYKKIIFMDHLKVQQLVKTLQSTNIKLVWLWSESIGVDKIINNLYNLKPIRQNKFIIGSGENSFILNFLQARWNWQVIYGKNFKEFLQNNNANNVSVAEIFETKKFQLSIINDYDIGNNYFLRKKIVGSDLLVLTNSIGTKNELNFKEKILFLDCICDTKNTFYRAINHLKNYMINNNIFPIVIIFGNILIDDGSSVAKILLDVSSTLRENNINIPFFQIKDFTFINLNAVCTIRYTNDNSILMTLNS